MQLGVHLEQHGEALAGAAALSISPRVLAAGAHGGAESGRGHYDIAAEKQPTSDSPLRSPNSLRPSDLQLEPEGCR